MAFSFIPLREQVIVITGASSGIGLAAARAAAAEGARLVLASRNDEALKELVKQIDAGGGEAIHVGADVGHREEVRRVADAALQRFGGIDTWVNNACARGPSGPGDANQNPESRSAPPRHRWAERPPRQDSTSDSFLVL